MALKSWKQILLILPAFFSSGCSRAPNIDVAGSFFPSWMICLALGIGVAIATHGFLQRRNLEPEVGTLAIFYPGLVVFLACVLWLLLFR